MNTIYKSRPSFTFQTMQEKAFDVQNEKHPAREVIRKNLGAYSLTAEFVEDHATVSLFPHINGLIAIVCTLKRGNEVIGQGRGTAVLSKVNRFIDRTVRVAFNSALVDAVVRSTKCLDVLDSTDGHSASTSEISTALPATDKQKSYLLELVNNNIDDKSERIDWEKKIKNISKDDASTAIQAFKNQ